MRSVAVFPDNNETFPDKTMQSICIGKLSFKCGIIFSSQPLFNRDTPEFHHKVLVRKLAFSCNYRDRNLIFDAVASRTASQPIVIGSDFIGEVVDVGAQVKELQKGDRVIGNCSYPCDISGAHSGVPSNHASSEYEVFHWAKLIQVPTNMPIAVAAAFSICAQTSYSMIRKVCIKAGDNVLVTAARSNTSLFILNALKRRKDIQLYAVTTSQHLLHKLQQLGISNAYYYNPIKSVPDNKHMHEVCTRSGGFNCILDPFADYYLKGSLNMLAFEGRYITCGMRDKQPEMAIFNSQNHSSLAEYKDMLYRTIANNLSFQGNCAGRMEDLVQAVSDYRNRDFDVTIDSVFEGLDVKSFLEQTYVSSDRFGKVVYQYS